MNARTLEPMLVNATVKAIDGVSRKAAEAKLNAEGLAGKLLARWNEMDRPQKEHVASIAIATATTAVTAILAMKRKPKKVVKKAAKNAVKRVAKKLA